MKRTPIYLVLILLVGLYLSNPKIEEFQQYIEEEIELATDSDNQVKKLLGQVLSDPAATLLMEATTRNEYYVGSMYTISLEAKEYKYIGVFDRFFPLHKEKITDLIKK